MTLTDQELATVLYGLRTTQEQWKTGAASLLLAEHFTEVTPLNPPEIDDLCERLNITGPATTTSAQLAAIDGLTLADVLRYFDGKATNRERQIAALVPTRDGELEVDGDLVSEGDDNGAYVMAWVWVDFGGTPFDKESWTCPGCNQRYTRLEEDEDVPVPSLCETCADVRAADAHGK